MICREIIRGFWKKEGCLRMPMRIHLALKNGMRKMTIIRDE